MDFKAGEILCINKPYTWSSFAVVNKVRYLLCRKMGVKKLKVGHTGTLDPLATGVMILCTGKATKRIEEFQYQTKEYVAHIRLGATTPSYDLELLDTHLAAQQVAYLIDYSKGAPGVGLVDADNFASFEVHAYESIRVSKPAIAQ